MERQGIPAGAVFFPDGNRLVGNQGFDSRLQAWDSFPPSLEWHPMSYANCNDTTWIPNIFQHQQCLLAKQQHQQQQQLKPKNTDIRDDNLNLVKLKRKKKSGCWSNTYLRFPWHYVPRR